MPRDFVRKFLRVRGWKWLHTVWCECSLGFVETKYPIKWLYKHVVMEHEPSFDCCHCWNRAVGRDTGEVEEWYRWFTFTWSKKRQDWIVTDTYQGCEGFEESSPAWCWR